jgi:hypothetical protein
MARVCPTCGHENADDDDFCGSCGAFLRWDPTQAVAAVTPHEAEVPAAEVPSPEGPAAEVQPAPEPEAPEPIAAAPATEGTPCPACGNEIPLDRHFCPSCGAYVTRSHAAIAEPADVVPVPAPGHEPAEPQSIPEPALAEPPPPPPPPPPRRARPAAQASRSIATSVPPAARTRHARSQRSRHPRSPSPKCPRHPSPRRSRRPSPHRRSPSQRRIRRHRCRSRRPNPGRPRRPHRSRRPHRQHRRRRLGHRRPSCLPASRS